MEARLPAVQDSVCGCRESPSHSPSTSPEHSTCSYLAETKTHYRSARYYILGTNHCRLWSWLKAPFRFVESLLTVSRRGFPSGFFHVLPLSDIVSKTFEEVIASRSGIPTFDREMLREQLTTVFLHQDDDYSLKRFLGILVRTSRLPRPLHIL